MERAIRTSALAAAFWLGARTAEAKYLAETPADILKIRGMPVALVVCVVGLLLLRRATVSAAGMGSGWSVRARWALFVAFALFIWATVPVGYQITRAIVIRIGHNAWQNSINAVGAVFGTVFVWHVLRHRERRRWQVAAALASISATYAYFFAILEVPVKRIHFMEYSALSVLAYYALQSRTTPWVYVWCALAATLVGVGDESIALALPQRFGAVSDVIFDTTGGVLGTLLLAYVFDPGSRAAAQER